MNDDTGQQLDPGVVNLAKAIRQSESGGNFSATGKSGEYGAYQFTPDTWNKEAPQYGIDSPLNSATPEQQNAVAYNQIKKWKDSGKDVTQIASMWNAGEGEPNAYTGKFSDGSSSVGTNTQGVKFNVPEYVKSVTSAYQTLKSGGQVAADPNNPSSVAPQDNGLGSFTPLPQAEVSQSVSVQNPVPSPNEQSQDQGLGQELGGRIQDASQAVSNTLSGKINPLSGVIQGVGAVAGAVGDMVNKGLELIPGFKGVENLLGQGVGYLAKTPVGQSVGKAIQDFSIAHPELSKDIGAGLNIATALPIFDGLAALKNVAMDSASIALKNIAEKGAIKDLSEVASRTIGGRNFISAVPESVKTMVQERALPEIVGGKYTTDTSTSKLISSISNIDEKQLQPVLEKISTNQNFGQSLSTLKKMAIQEAENDTTLKEAGVVPQALKQIENRFNGWAHSYGDSVDLATENRLKIGSGKFSDWSTPEGSADKAIYRTFQKNIEDVANQNGFSDVKAINQKMASLIKAKELLQYINGKAVKNKGLLHGLIQGAATAGGEVAGNAVGVPFAGAIVGNKTSGLIESALSGFSPRAIRNNILERTAQGATRQTVKGLVSRTGGLVAGSIVNQANR